MVPTIGPSMRPMPPITVMKITKAVQSLTLKAVSGEMRSFIRKISAPIIAVPKAGQHIDDEFDAGDVDAVALRRQFVVADGGEREAVARAQQRDDGAEHGDGQRQRQPIDLEFAHLPGRRHGDHDRCRQADAGTATEHRDLRREQAEHLRHHPGADGEVRAAQPEDQRRHRNRNKAPIGPAIRMATIG